MGDVKNRVRFSTTISRETSETLKRLSAETMIPISKLIDLAVSELLIPRENQPIDLAKFDGLGEE